MLGSTSITGRRWGSSSCSEINDEEGRHPAMAQH
jgi:hypothetical protein